MTSARAVHGVHVRNVLQSGCGGPFAIVTLDFEPAGAASFACALSEEELPGEYREALAAGVRAESDAAGVPLAAVLRQARWHEVDSHARGFHEAGVHAVREALRCLAEGDQPRPVVDLRPVRRTSQPVR
ncbi:hypothetical protein P3T37_001156 [Kitasatospora sp. MAA4]|uniref:hypothetical protein n=1 Tax=Kitasatospora sp. MAA4 TaxID=3035093 RepID=UPI002475742A|nr:hypothetical protein [Kitasatospora sp. MAA4]MDH6131782.1 hypothetical protein [Kitasatospora sp. MAA4]